MRALPTWRRSVVLVAFTALLGMHGVSAGHEAMASLSPAPAMSTMSIMANRTALPEVHQASVPPLPAGLMATTCLALLGLGVALLLPRTGRLHGLTHLANPRVLGPTRVVHWPWGPDPVAELGISRT